MKIKGSVNVHVWVPDLLASKGGIQTYSAFLLDAMRSVNHCSVKRVFIKNERYPVAGSSFESQQYNLSCAGTLNGGFRTINFSLQALWHSLVEKPDLIITTHINFSPLARYISNLFGIPYWIIAHGIDAWGITETYLKKSLQGADKILAVSHFTRNRLLEEQEIKAEKIVVLPNTFDEHKFVIRDKPQHLLSRYHLQKSQPVILTVARLDNKERYKGYDMILESLLLVRRGIPNIHYLIVGKGKDETRIQKLINKLGLERNVTLTGFVPDDELCDYYNLCDVYAMPSKKEGFGIVYLEALACGKPVIAGNADGAVDALCGGELGVLIDPDRSDVIAKALIEIINKTYPQEILYNPQLLRQRVMDAYGFTSFRATLKRYLDEFHFFKI